MNYKVVTIAVLCLLIAGKCQVKNILCLMGIGAETSDKWNKVLLKELENREHQLTIITATQWPEVDEDDFKNAEFIHLEKTQHFLKERYESVSQLDLLAQSTWKFITHWYDRQMATCRANLESIGFSEALHLAIKEKRKYDLIIYDITYGAGCLLHLAYLYGDIPIIGITSGQLNDQNMVIPQASLLNPAMDPYILSDFGEEMNYWKRVQNAALYAFDYLYRKWVVKPVIEGMWSKNMHSKNIITPTSFDQLMPRFKVILANYHPSLHSLKSLPINVIPVPGLHIQETEKSSLSSEILKFIEDTKLEVILIDLDKNIIGTENVQKLLDVMNLYPDNGFIWTNFGGKFTGKSKPKNLLLATKVGAGEILAHDKVRCSVIFPENLDIQESLYHGVPAITVTSRLEQRYIVQRLLERNLGLNLELDKFDKSLLQQSLLTCLNRKSLRRRVLQFQASLKQQQNPSLDTAAWWVEHILENPQANDHLLAPQSEKLNFLTQRSLDVIVVLQIFIVLSVINTIWVMRQTILNFKNVSKKSKNKENKNKLNKSKENKPETIKKSKKAKAKTS